MQAGVGFVALVFSLVGRFAGTRPLLFASTDLGELGGWHELPQKVRRPVRTPRFFWLAVLVLPLACLPLPTRLSAPAHLKAQQSFTVYAPPGAQVLELPWKDGAPVAQGAALVRLGAPELKLRSDRVQARLADVREQAAAETGDTALQQAIAAAETERAGLQAEAVRYAPVAPFGGRVHVADPELRPGQWVRRQQALLTVVKPGAWQVETSLDEEQARRVQAGDGARFYAAGHTEPALSLRVTAVDQAAGGKYRVTLVSRRDPHDLSGHAWDGTVVIYGTWEAPLLRRLRAAFAPS